MTATDQFTHGPREARTPVARTGVLPLAAAGSIASSPFDYVLVLIRASKLHNWLKNLLLFAPIVFGHALTATNLRTLGLAFVAFGCAASAHYVLNDLIDKPRDRRDGAKRYRPQASGQLTSGAAVAFALALIAVAAICAAGLPTGFQAVLVGYFGLCLVYSLLLRRLPVLDVLALVILHDLRLMGGAAAAAVPLSGSLLAAFSCLFLALALLKRVVQIDAAEEPRGRLLGRFYDRSDLPLLRRSAGIAAAICVAAFTLALYGLGTDRLVFVLIPGLGAIWLGRCFHLARHRRLSEDLVLFITTDYVSLLALAATISVLVAAG